MENQVAHTGNDQSQSIEQELLPIQISTSLSAFILFTLSFYQLNKLKYLDDETLYNGILIGIGHVYADVVEYLYLKLMSQAVGESEAAAHTTPRKLLGFNITTAATLQGLVYFLSQYNLLNRVHNKNIYFFNIGFCNNKILDYVGSVISNGGHYAAQFKTTLQTRFFTDSSDNLRHGVEQLAQRNAESNEQNQDTSPSYER